MTLLQCILGFLVWGDGFLSHPFQCVFMRCVRLESIVRGMLTTALFDVADA